MIEYTNKALSIDDQIALKSCTSACTFASLSALFPIHIYNCPQMATDRHGFSHALRWCWLASRYTCLTQINFVESRLRSLSNL